MVNTHRNDNCLALTASLCSDWREFVLTSMSVLVGTGFFSLDCLAASSAAKQKAWADLTLQRSSAMSFVRTAARATAELITCPRICFSGYSTSFVGSPLRTLPKPAPQSHTRSSYPAAASMDPRLRGCSFAGMCIAWCAAANVARVVGVRVSGLCWDAVMTGPPILNVRVLAFQAKSLRTNPEERLILLRSHPSFAQKPSTMPAASYAEAQWWNESTVFVVTGCE
jgi:hypothetical protein